MLRAAQETALPPVLTPEGVCRYLAVKTNRPDRWVRARAATGLRVLKVGKTLRVLSSDLTRWLETSYVDAK